MAVGVSTVSLPLSLQAAEHPSDIFAVGFEELVDLKPSAIVHTRYSLQTSLYYSSSHALTSSPAPPSSHCHPPSLTSPTLPPTPHSSPSPLSPSTLPPQLYQPQGVGCRAGEGAVTEHALHPPHSRADGWDMSVHLHPAPLGALHQASALPAHRHGRDVVDLWTPFKGSIMYLKNKKNECSSSKCP